MNKKKTIKLILKKIIKKVNLRYLLNGFKSINKLSIFKQHTKTQLKAVIVSKFHKTKTKQNLN